MEEEACVVFFHNGCAARFLTGNVVFTSQSGKRFAFVPGLADKDPTELLRQGAQIVNWDNVSYVRKFEQREDD